MLQAWLSIGYIILLGALSCSPLSYGAGGGPVRPSLQLVVGIPLWFGWGTTSNMDNRRITGTQVRRSDPARP